MTTMASQQRMVFLVASLDDKDAADRAQASIRHLLQGLPNRQAARQAVHDILKGIDTCTRHGARARLQVALDALNLIEQPHVASVVPLIVKQALLCLSAQCRHDPAVTTALATLMSSLATRLAESSEPKGHLTVAPAATQGQWLYQEFLSPLIRSSYRDPEARRVAAGCWVLSAIIEALAPAAAVPHLAVALRAGLAAALEHMWVGSSARRVSAAYAPFRPWVVAVGGERLGEEGARRLAAICCRGAADKEAWQVRRDALQTLASLLTAAQADAEPRKRPVVPLSRTPSSNVDATEGVPERATWARTPGACSGALEVLAAQRGRLLDALDSCRHDAIAAVRAAAAEARTAAVKLPLAVPHAADNAINGGRGSPGRAARGGVRSSSAAPGVLTPKRSGTASPGKARRRSPNKTPQGLGCSSPNGGSAGRSGGFQRPRLPSGTPLDFGVQVFAPPSPPRRQQQPQGQHSGSSPIGGQWHTIDTAAQTFDAWGPHPYSQAAVAGGPGSPPMGSPGSGAGGSPFGAAAGQGYGSPQGRMEVGHVFSGRVELAVGLPEGAQQQQWQQQQQQQQRSQPQQQQQQRALPQALEALRHANSRVDGLLAELTLGGHDTSGPSGGPFGGDPVGHVGSGGMDRVVSLESAVLADIRRTLPELDGLVEALRTSGSTTATRGRGSPTASQGRGSPTGTRGRGSPTGTRGRGSPSPSPRGFVEPQQAEAFTQQQQQVQEWGHQQLQQQRSPRTPPPLQVDSSPQRAPYQQQPHPTAWDPLQLQQPWEQQQQNTMPEAASWQQRLPSPVAAAPQPASVGSSPRHITTQWHPSPSASAAPAPMEAASPARGETTPGRAAAPPAPAGTNAAASAAAAAADAAAAAAAGHSQPGYPQVPAQMGDEAELLLALSWRLRRLARGFACSSQSDGSAGSGAGGWPAQPSGSAGDSSGGGSDGSLPRALPPLKVLWEELEHHKREPLASLQSSSGGGDGSISFGWSHGGSLPHGPSSGGGGVGGTGGEGGVGGSLGGVGIDTTGLPAAAIVMLKQHADEEAQAAALRDWWEHCSGTAAKRSSTGPGTAQVGGLAAGGGLSPRRQRWAVPHAESAPPCVARWPSFGEPQI